MDEYITSNNQGQHRSVQLMPYSNHKNRMTTSRNKRDNSGVNIFIGSYGLLGLGLL